MKQHILKSAIIAEIKRLYKAWRWYSSIEAKYKCETYKELLEFIDTLEVKYIKEDLTWQDIKLISEIGDNFINSDESDNLSEEEYYTEILRRFKNDKRKSQTNN